MPCDLLADEIHGVPRNLLRRRAVEAVPPALRGALAGIELAAASPIVSLGLTVERVAWRARWSRAGLPELSGFVPVWRGEVV